MVVQIQLVQEDRLCSGAITDASWANATNGNSQGGFAALCYDEELVQTGIAPHQGTCGARGWAKCTEW